MSINLLSAPSEIQWQRTASASMSGDASSLMPMATTSRPAFCAASRASTGKRPLPAMRPERMLLDEAALGGADEYPQFVHSVRRRDFKQDSFHSLRRFKARAGQQAKGFVHSVNGGGG